VAIKKIFDVLEMDNIDAMRILREVKILRHLNGHPYIVSLEKVIPALNQASGSLINEVYLLCGYVPYDLARLIRSGKLKNGSVPKLTRGILRGLKHIHDSGIMHRDMKPRNILVDENDHVRIADFGLAIGMAAEPTNLINYVVTRWYRAPELLLNNQEYDNKIDLWSLGCILGEMLAKKPLFRGGNAKEQLRLILSVLGKPTEEDTTFVQKAAYRKLLLNMREQERKEFSTLLPTASMEAIDLLKRFLQFHPDKRLSVDTALTHPFLQDSSALDEPCAHDFEARPFVFSTDEEEVPLPAVLDMLAAEVSSASGHPLGSSDSMPSSALDLTKMLTQAMA